MKSKILTTLEDMLVVLIGCNVIISYFEVHPFEILEVTVNVRIS